MFNKTAFWAIFQFAQRFYLNTVFDHRVHVFHKTWNYFAVHVELWTAMRLNFRTVKVMLYETIHRNTALQCWNNVATIRNNIATMLQRRVAACAKNRGCEFDWTFAFSAGQKFARLPFWLSLCSCRCLDIVNFLLRAKCKTGCYFLPILNQPQGVAKQWERGEGSNRAEKREVSWDVAMRILYISGFISVTTLNMK